MKNMLRRLALAQAAIAANATGAGRVIGSAIAGAAGGDGQARPFLHFDRTGGVGFDKGGDFERRAQLAVADLVDDRPVFADQSREIGIIDRRAIEILG